MNDTEAKRICIVSKKECPNEGRTKVEQRSNDDLTMFIRRCLSESQRKDTTSRGAIVDFSRLL